MTDPLDRLAEREDTPKLRELDWNTFVERVCTCIPTHLKRREARRLLAEEKVLLNAALEELAGLVGKKNADIDGWRGKWADQKQQKADALAEVERLRKEAEREKWVAEHELNIK